MTSPHIVKADVPVSADPIAESLRDNSDGGPAARGEPLKGPAHNGSAPATTEHDSKQASPTTGRAGELRRNVLVMMPFRSDDSFERRVQVLEFLRIKYIVEKEVSVPRIRSDRAEGAPAQDAAATNGTPKDPTSTISYKVKALHHRVGYFPERALNAIAEADVLIGFVTSQSANVMFELTARHLLRDGLVLLVDGTKADLPIYFEGMIQINYQKLRSVVVDEFIRKLAASQAPSDYNDDAPLGKLEESIHVHDRDLVSELSHALKEVEEPRNMRPAYIRSLARYVSPAAIVESWESLNPFCVVQVDWSGMSGNGHYTHADLAGGPWISSANKSFLDFYGLRVIPDPSDSAHALDANKLLARLKDMGVCTEGYRKFKEDQEVTGEEVFFMEKNISASEPLIINGRHDVRFQNQKFLPTVVGRTTVGDREHHHRSYLLVLYVPIGKADTSASTVNTPIEIWRELHALQTAMCFPLELPMYYGSPSWMRARTVLDVGTGHGDYVRELARRFPDKKYVGVDVVPEYIANAQRSSEGIHFDVGDLMSLEGTYDFVIVRLLLQHLVDVPAALAAIARITAPGGSALVIDALDDMRAFVPPLPEVCRFFDAYRLMERRAGRDRDIMQHLPAMARDTGQWTVGCTSNVLIPSTSPEALRIFRQVYSRVIDLIAPSLNGDCNVAALSREWTWWCGLTTAYAQVGLSMTRLDRNFVDAGAETDH